MDTKEFWKGEFGDEYTARNVGMEESNYRMFRELFGDDNYECSYYEGKIKSICEFGAGAGMNIRALKRIFPDAQYTAVEINESACKQLASIDELIICNNSITEYNQGITKQLHDLVLCKGVLIHVHPDELAATYKVIYETSNKYILLCEYYNPTPVEVPYRGNTGKLWKRDFAGDMMDMFPNLILVEYGFEYHRGANKLDDITWFLLSK